MGSDASHATRARHALLIGSALILFAFALRLVVEAFSVPSSSMEPTLLPGDHLLVVRYVIDDPRRGDVVVFDDGSGTARVKRIIGVAGDSVRIDHGRVFVNGEALAEESYVSPSHSTADTVHVVPQAHYFLLGDNRDESADSREIGFVPGDALIGRVRLVYWSGSGGWRIRWNRVFRAINRSRSFD